ncbi:unnamed protein product [Mytilus coruscus]|uniref:Uncharacterized protein n=1 Tax=Mytilus coruscus TaxID=42192 RepID=A0A6J8BCB9_MYTCO|nr:unnamed protein product [Mytilus coruscus]
MYRILTQCGAQVRTSLEGIDYFVAEGGRAIRTIIDILNELDQTRDEERLMLVHIAANSEEGDHCLMYALSDSIHPQFAHPCQHQHNSVCVSCEQLKDATFSIQKLVECTNIVGENEKLNDMSFKIKQSIQSINNLKRHIVRCKNQDKAKSKLFETICQDEVFLVSDWSMKYLPRKYREDQSDWFAKRGLPWHITMAFRKSDEVIESLGFVHIFQIQIAQDSLTTAAIIIDVINCIQTMKGSDLSFHLWSDNAGCYKSSE